MNKVVRSLLVLALAILGTAPLVWGQVTEAEMRALPVPPVKGYMRTKALAPGFDFGNYHLPLVSFFDLGTPLADDFVYVHYTGVAGRKIHVESVWGTTPIPPPGHDAQGNVTDACGHAHNSYGVWGKSDTGWRFLGGGSMSGVRQPGGPCVYPVKADGTFDTAANPFLARIGGVWGRQFLILDFTNNSTYTELVVGALSNTHGWGSCDAHGQFPACHEPSYIMLYTWP